MSQFIHEHPWAFVWLVVFTLFVLDNMVDNIAKAIGRRHGQ